LSNAQILWDNWSKFDDLDSVYRQGFFKIRAYGCPNRNIENAVRADSVLTHSSRAAILLSDIMDLWPSYYQDVDKYAALKVMLGHDIAEVAIGDICDDGRKEHEEKKDVERQIVWEHYYNSMSENAYMLYRDIFQEFEQADTLLGQTLKMADKLDFIAKLIKLESQGYKLDNTLFYSDNDLILAEEINDYRFIDVVGNHFRHGMEECNFDQRLVQIAISFITCGLRTINRPFFEWWPIPAEISY